MAKFKASLFLQGAIFNSLTSFFVVFVFLLKCVFLPVLHFLTQNCENNGLKTCKRIKTIISLQWFQK